MTNVEEIKKIMKKNFDTANALDLEGFMTTWDEDIRIEFIETGQVLEGIEAVRQHYIALFEQVTEVHIEAEQTILHNNFVVNKEIISSCSNPDFVGMKTLWINEVIDGKIKRAWAFP
jgi:hypothetical protein